MATQHLNTHVYTLNPAVAASLRVPPIHYENNVIPGDVLSRVTGYPETDTPLSELDELLTKRITGLVNK